MFGKLYFLGLGLVLFVTGTAFSFASGLASEPCSRLASLPQGFDVAFNPCSIFSSLPGMGVVMQALGVVIAVVALVFIARSAKNLFLACPDCGRRVKQESAFCPSCGAKLAKPSEGK